LLLNFFKIKKYYFNKFLNENYFKKNLLPTLKIKNCENCLEWLECIHIAWSHVRSIFMYFECKMFLVDIRE